MELNRIFYAAGLSSILASGIVHLGAIFMQRSLDQETALNMRTLQKSFDTLSPEESTSLNRYFNNKVQTTENIRYCNNFSYGSCLVGAMFLLGAFANIHRQRNRIEIFHHKATAEKDLGPEFLPPSTGFLPASTSFLAPTKFVPGSYGSDNNDHVIFMSPDKEPPHIDIDWPRIHESRLRRMGLGPYAEKKPPHPAPRPSDN